MTDSPGLSPAKMWSYKLWNVKRI